MTRPEMLHCPMEKLGMGEGLTGEMHGQEMTESGMTRPEMLPCPMEKLGMEEGLTGEMHGQEMTENEMQEQGMNRIVTEVIQDLEKTEMQKQEVTETGGAKDILNIGRDCQENARADTKELIPRRAARTKLNKGAAAAELPKPLHGALPELGPWRGMLCSKITSL